MAQLPGLTTTMIPFMSMNNLQDVLNILDDMNPSKTVNLMKDIYKTLINMDRVLLLEGVNPNYQIESALASAESSIDMIEYLHPDKKAQISLLRDKVRNFITYYRTNVMMYVQGETFQDKRLTLTANLNEVSKETTCVAKFYNTCLSNVYKFQELMPKRKGENNLDKLPVFLKDILDGTDIQQKSVVAVSSLFDFNYYSKAKDNAKNLSTLLYIANNVTIKTLRDYIGVQDEVWCEYDLKRALDAMLVDGSHEVKNTIVDNHHKPVFKDVTFQEVKDLFEKRYLINTDNILKFLKEYNFIPTSKPELTDYDLRHYRITRQEYDSLEDYEKYIEAEVKRIVESRALYGDLLGLQVTLVTMLLQVGYWSFYREDMATRRDMLDLPFNTIGNGIIDNQIIPLDKFVLYGVDMLGSEVPEEVEEILQTWWVSYSPYYKLILNQTKLPGLLPHTMWTYTNEKYCFDTILKSLLRCGLTIHESITNRRRSDGKTGVSYSKFNKLLTFMVSKLSETQYSVSKNVNYEESNLKPAHIIIADCEKYAHSIHRTLESLLNTFINENVQIDDNTHLAVNSISALCHTVDSICKNTDLSLVDNDYQKWFKCNEFFSMDVNPANGHSLMTSVASDRFMLMAVYGHLYQLNEKNKIKDLVFDDISVVGTTLSSMIKSGASEMKKKQNNTLVNYIRDMNNQDLINNRYSIDVPMTLSACSKAKAEVANVIDTLQKRLKYLTDWNSNENIDNSKKSGYDYGYDDKPTFKESKRSYLSFIEQNCGREITGHIESGFKFRYGHTEVGTALYDIKSREKMIEPQKVADSDAKSYIDRTIQTFRTWYLNLEAKEFQLTNVDTPNDAVIPYF